MSMKDRVFMIVVLAFFGPWLCQLRGVARAQSSGQAEGGSVAGVYDEIPTMSAIMGYFATGMALVDINGNGLPDMITSNGNDMSPQQLTVSLNLGESPFISPRPEWVSRESQYMMRLAVGDINSDGWMDVAVSLPFDVARNVGAGGVQVFFNRGGRLEPYASYRTGGGFSSAGCALADVDADGDLDLAVAVSLEGAGVWPPQAGQVLKPGHARIYLNNDGELETSPSWESEVPLGALQVVAADINQDGWMDLAFAGDRIAVFYGSAPGPDERIPLPRLPSWTSDERFPYSFSIDAGFPGRVAARSESQTPSGRSLMLAVSTGCLTSTKEGIFFPHWPNLLVDARGGNLSECTSHFLTYLPTKYRTAVWQSQEAQNASTVLLADLTADGRLDLIANQWGPLADNPRFDFPGAPLWIFQGFKDGFEETPQFVSGVLRVGGGLAVNGLRAAGTQNLIHRFNAVQQVAVLTLPERIVEVVGVRLRGRALSSDDYAWAPGSNAVSLAWPLRSGQSAEVSYRTTKVLDIAEAVWNPQFGNNIYFSFLNPGAVESPE